MSDPLLTKAPRLTWNFPRTFWFANSAELCERFAYYGMFITLVRYLNADIGFTDPQAGWIAGIFSSVLYFLPTFMGIMADKIGFKQALALAFVLLGAGYAGLGLAGREVLTEPQGKLIAVGALALIMFGGAIVKPVIAGTVAKCSDANHRARAMSVFYMMVNIGSFGGKFLAGHLNARWGMQYISYYSSGMCFLALLLVILFYRNVDTKGTGKSLAEALNGLFKVMGNFRFLSLILIVAGFWAIQGQLYATMCSYIERLLGQGYRPEWLANINPLVVVLLVVPITHVVRSMRPENAIGIGLLIIPFTALVIALTTSFDHLIGGTVHIGSLAVPPLIITVVLGVGLQGLAECFLSPKFLEFASKQAPEGEVGLYLGYQNLTSFFGWLFGFVLAGYLLDWFCPDPQTLSAADHAQWEAALAGHGALPGAYAHAHYIWFVFTGVGVTAFIGLLAFKYVTGRIDRRRSLAE